VEDNDMNQELAVGAAEQVEGMRWWLPTRPGSSGHSGVVTRDFDGVLMDCQMPVMDGYTATAPSFAEPGLQHLPIIAMTANAMAGDKEKVLEAGMCDHIAKPLNVSAMFATMARWIQPGSGASAGTKCY
jgi:two-component system sensor histidine kinase/response regulator